MTPSAPSNFPVSTPPRWAYNAKDTLWAAGGCPAPNDAAMLNAVNTSGLVVNGSAANDTNSMKVEIRARLRSKAMD